jgi:3-deoxy-D-manno-octulosonate 8-phosphate phosphatase (KDO 8-P phosphatase)
MGRSRLSCAPANAHLEVSSRAHHVTRTLGGHGAVREFCDLLVIASGRYAGLLNGYLS